MAMGNKTNSSAFWIECFLLDVNLDFTQYLFIAHILTSVLNSLFCIVATGGNVIVILAVWKTPALHTPSNVFLCCLALSDLTVGLIAQPCFVIHKIGELYHDYSIYCTTRILIESLGYITAGTSVLTMTGIAIERYLAIHLHLRYKEIITIKRVLIAVLFIWVFFVLLAASRFWIANDSIFNNIAIPLIFASLAFTFVAYMRVLKYVRRHETQIRDQKSLQTADRCPVNYRLSRIMRYKKSTLTMVFIVGMFVLCYIPFLCVKIIHKIEGYTTEVKTAYLYASSIVFLNSSFNPVIYCWRIPDIRRAVKDVCSPRCFRGNSANVVSTASSGVRRNIPNMSVSFNVTRASLSIVNV